MCLGAVFISSGLTPAATLNPNSYPARLAPSAAGWTLALHPRLNFLHPSSLDLDIPAAYFAPRLCLSSLKLGERIVTIDREQTQEKFPPSRDPWTFTCVFSPFAHTLPVPVSASELGN